MAPEQVARVVERIAATRAPRLRYPVGSQARLVPLLKHWLPEALFIPIVRRAYGL